MKKFYQVTCLIFAINMSQSLSQTVKSTKNSQESLLPVFKLETLNPFSPGNSISDIPDKFKPGVDVEIEKALKIKKYLIRHEAYYFPLWVQYFNGRIIDFYTRLPSYFLHDTFHQSLINRFGKQNIYTLKDSTATYTWENDQTKRVYSGGCTITCYPIYYTEIQKARQQVPTTYKPLTDHFYAKIP